MPQPDGVLHQSCVRTPRGDGGGPAHGLVVGVTVVAPGRGQQGALPRVADGVDDRGDQRLLEVDQPAVGVPEAHHLGAGGEQRRRPLQLAAAAGRERTRVMGRGDGVGPLAGRGRDHEHVPAGAPGEVHQSPGAERLVVGVGTDDHQPVEASRLEVRQVEVGQRVVGQGARPRRGRGPLLVVPEVGPVTGGRRAAAGVGHHAGSGSSSSRPPRAAWSRSACHCRT